MTGAGAASLPAGIRRNVPLAPRTSLRLGGTAELFAEVADEASLAELLAWADGQGLPVTLLGGGSNVVVPDAGIAGLVLSLAWKGIAVESQRRDEVRLRVAAGEPWDPLVARTVAEGLAGLECLSGIPGLVGATPIQNVGAYGVEVAELVREVRVFDRRTGRVAALAPEACGFAYRDSRFRRAPGAQVVLDVVFGLRPGGEPAVRYPELARALPAGPSEAAPPDLAQVRRTVLALRRGKSMVLGVPGDPNGCTAGSFFTNPIVPRERAAELVRQAVETGLVDDPEQVPRWELPDGRVKLAAGWLVERAGFPKGTRRGPVGVSSRHALALVHHGGGTSRALLALAQEIVVAVQKRFQVTLVREPVLLGS
ncbi:MAG TPA: UDP-N-acetylmuramate dehydrogenase [Polyangiaceae bacterium LLY-WYZ-14_1]|nr:UDP-N-acetylmuramate dehydrogenase [Polyangiaceae bacterium LLY-WYZ-14_1]